MIQIDPNQQLETGAEQRPVKVCIQGYSGAFHEIAARLCFAPRQVEIQPALTFEEVVDSLESAQVVDAGLMAIENTLAGSLMHNYKLLHRSRLHIVGETYLRIKQNLMALPGVRIEELREVHSHPIAIEQCRAFFRAHPHIRLVEMEDTALAARNIRDTQSRHIGAIASTLASEIYSMDILAEGIETNKKNHTRFLVLSRTPVRREGADKVSLSFSVSHQVGSLYKVLAVLAAYNINLTKVQSAPIIGKPWEYRFFVDFISAGTVGYDHAIEAIRPLAHDLRVLGVYPQGQHYEH